MNTKICRCREEMDYPDLQDLPVCRTKRRQRRRRLERIKRSKRRTRFDRTNTHIAQNVRWTSILGPKIQLTSTSWPDCKWTSIGCSFRDEEGTFTWEYEMDLRGTSPGCPFWDEEWTYKWILNGFEMDIHWMYHMGWEMDVDLDKILIWKQ